MLFPLPVPGCTQTQTVESVTAVESGKLCALFLGPGLRTLSYNSVPFPINAFLQKSVDPANVVYSEPRLAPGGEGPKPGPPEMPPAISAWTGLNSDSVVPGPAPSVPLPRIPGAAMPLPPPPSRPEPPPPLLPAEGTHP
jgi:hypothetical protein